LGIALACKGQLDDAIAAFRQAIALNPNIAETHRNLGIALRDKGRFDEAIAAFRRAIALEPNFAEAHNNLGIAFCKNEQFQEAIGSCQKAIELRPNIAEAHNTLGVAMRAGGRLDEAIAACRQAIALSPNFAEAHNNLGVAFRDKGQLEEAIAACRQAIALRPNYAEAYTNLGNALRDQGQFDEAVAACRQAIALNPSIAEAHSSLGMALFSKGQIDDAIAACRKAIAVRPDYADGHFTLATMLLARGDFQQGWEEQEWRWKSKDPQFGHRNFAQPQWDGRPLDGRTLLLHTEQGFGDAVQFIRYFPMAEQRGGKIILECQAELYRLFQIMAGTRQIVVRGQPLPAFDFHCPLLSLPWVFRTTLSSIPHAVPYLHPDAEDVRRWQNRLAEYRSSVKVGLAWAGRATHRNDRNRSIKLASLAPLAGISGVRFFSLQKGDAAAEAKFAPSGMELVDFTDELKDFAETAALIENLDLVISVDTAVVHLAGAMGKGVWVLVPFPPDWRWLLDRADSPWYPTMRLFRQETPGDWDGVIRRVAAELSLAKA
jgi:tetratricopeptide (TPR) repeat protein